jgi:hypothetical protein
MLADPGMAARLPVALLLVLALSRFALAEETQPAAPPSVTPPPTTSTPTNANEPPPKAPTIVVDGPELSGILGREALSRKGEKMGQIVDVLADHEGKVRAAIIDFGGFLGVGSRKIAVDWSAVHFVPGGKTTRIVLDLSRDEVLGAHEYKDGQAVTILEAAPAASSTQN